MDAKFYPAIATIKTGDVEKLRELVAADPSLATSRSTVSHPTLLQCLALDGKNKPNAREMAKVLIDAGADVNEPLGACASPAGLALGLEAKPGAPPPTRSRRRPVRDA